MEVVDVGITGFRISGPKSRSVNIFVQRPVFGLRWDFTPRGSRPDKMRPPPGADLSVSPSGVYIYIYIHIYILYIPYWPGYSVSSVQWSASMSEWTSDERAQVGEGARHLELKCMLCDQAGDCFEAVDRSKFCRTAHLWLRTTNHITLHVIIIPGGGPNVRKKLGHPPEQPNMRWSNSDA